MNSFENRSSDFQQNAGSAEETLRLIANLPAPDGLAERVHARLRKAPQTARVLNWPSAASMRGCMRSGALRGAAAAAIVCIVAGGGWTISSRVQPAMAPAAKVMAVPARTGNTGGFSSANAIRTPQTLNGPVLTHRLTTQRGDDDKSVLQPVPSARPKVKSGKKDKQTAVPQSAPQAQQPDVQ